MQFSMPSVGKWIAIALSLIIGSGALYLRSRISQPEKTEEGYNRITSYNVCYTKLLRLHLLFSFPVPAIADVDDNRADDQNGRDADAAPD